MKITAAMARIKSDESLTSSRRLKKLAPLSASRQTMNLLAPCSRSLESICLAPISGSGEWERSPRFAVELPGELLGELLGGKPLETPARGSSIGGSPGLSPRGEQGGNGREPEPIPPGKGGGGVPSPWFLAAWLLSHSAGSLEARSA